MDTPKTQFLLGVVILAAGASTRMGQPKLLLRWGDRSVLAHLIQEWSKLHPGRIAVVHAGPDSPVEQELDRLGFGRENRILNPQAERGMFSSIQCAAAWTGWEENLTHWAIVLGDQPHLRLETLRRLAGFAQANPGRICQPSREGRARHPVILPALYWGHLAGTRQPNLKEFLRSESDAVTLCEMDDPGLDLDLDSPADYERALQLYFGTRPC